MKVISQIFGFALILCSDLSAVPSPIYNPTPIHEAFVTSSGNNLAPTPITRQPPAPIDEPIPSKTFGDAIWIPGYWAWVQDMKDFKWVCGVWRRPPPNHVWIAGSWLNSAGGWVWAPGFWSHTPLEKLVYIQTTPPSPVDDQVPAAPNQSSFWIPGYWEYSFGTKQYSWLSGKWEPFNQNWILAPASYIWRPAGYVFVPLHWDLSLEARGNAYSCDDRGVPIVIEPGAILQQLFFCYPDYLPIYWHWWHIHPGWWDGCWCVPPWWFWSGWWTFCPCDLWGLWWWWGHPGFPPPFWLSLELSQKIAPPSQQLIDFFKKIPKPHFPFKPGKTPLLPTGPTGLTDVPKPHLLSDVMPGGQVTPPSLPGRQVTPPMPPQWQGPQTPSQPWQPQPQVVYPEQPRYPSYPYEPYTPTQPYYPPQNWQPPNDYYPERPRHPTKPHYPNYPDQSQTTPPRNVYPTYPRHPPSSTQPNYQPNPNLQLMPHTPPYTPSRSSGKS